MINHHWQQIHNNGCSVEFTTLTRGRAYAYLIYRGERIARTYLMSNRVNAKEMARLAINCGIYTRISFALERLTQEMGAAIAESEAEDLAAVMGKSASVSTRQGARL